MVGYFIFSIISSIIFALLEIQIEGENGWAEKLPTWRKKNQVNKNLYGRQQRANRLPHLLWSFIFFLSHSTFIITPWSITNELRILSYVFFVIFIENFLWFVFNPKFGLKKFKKQHVKWHKNWFGPFPVQYYWGFLLWLILFLNAYFL
jgi:hypothetical protein